MNGHKLRQRLVALLAILVVAAGCAEGNASPAPAPRIPHYFDVHELVAAVAERQRSDGSARLSLHGEITGATSLVFTGEGELQLRGEAVSMKFTQVVTPAGAPPQESGFVVLPDSVYVRPAGTGAPGSKPWARADPRDKRPEAAQLTTLATTLTDSADPMKALSRNADATLISDVVDDVIDGKPVVRYTIVIDLARAASLQPDPQLRGQLEHQVRGGLARITSTLWVDGNSRPLRSAVRQALPGIGTLSIIGDYFDWGGPVSIAAPPASEVR